MSTLRANNITTYRHSARKFSPRTDFRDFDYILAMDDENLAHLEALRREEVKRQGGQEEGMGKVMLFGEFGGRRRKAVGKRSERGEEIDDPYYGGDEGFRVAYAQCEKFGKCFLERLERGELS